MNGWILSFLSCFSITLISATPLRFKELQNGIGMVATVCEPTQILVNAEGWKLTAADFLQHGYQPVHITVENRSDTAVVISEASVQYASLELKDLIEVFKVNVPLRTIGYFVAAQVASIVAFLGSGAFVYHRFRRPIIRVNNFDLLSGFSLAVFFFPYYSTPFYCWHLRRDNNRLYDLTFKALHEGTRIIRPKDRAEKVILVPIDSIKRFDFSVFTAQAAGIHAKFLIKFT